MNILCNKLRTALYCALLTAALGTLSASANAADEDVPSKVVHFDDLNLASSAGIKVLYNRIHAAARDVCGISASDDPIMREAVHVCINKAIDEAVLHVNAPSLTAMRFGGNGIRLASE